MKAGVRHGPRTDGGHMANLCVVIDLFSRRVVGPLSADLLCKSPAGQWDLPNPA